MEDSAMETDVNYTLVGAFVISLTACIILAIIWLSSGLGATDYKVFKVYMKEAVSGLSPDAPVEYNGVNVGNVSSIKINRKNPQLVELLLNIKKETPITEGTRAKLDVRSLTGIAYMALVDKGTDMTPLIVRPGEKYPVINTIPSIFVRLDIALTQLSDSFHQISSSIHALLDPENLKAIKQSLINIRTLTGTLANNSPQLEIFLQNSSKAAQIFRGQTLPAVNQALSDFGSVGHNLSDFSADLKQNPSIIIRGKEQPALGPGEH